MLRFLLFPHDPISFWIELSLDIIFNETLELIYYCLKEKWVNFLILLMLNLFVHN